MLTLKMILSWTFLSVSNFSLESVDIAASLRSSTTISAFEDSEVELFFDLFDFLGDASSPGGGSLSSVKNCAAALLLVCGILNLQKIFAFFQNGKTFFATRRFQNGVANILTD
jgi:hypothetical protein